MSEKIKPALSGAEFRDEVMDDPSLLGDVRYVAGESATNACKIIALANHALPDEDPRKITRAMVNGLRSRASEYQGLHRIGQPGDWHGDASFFADLADALETYLPPL